MHDVGESFQMGYKWWQYLAIYHLCLANKTVLQIYLPMI